MLKKIVFLSVLMASCSAYSCPSPLGLELGKATTDDVKKKYGNKKHPLRLAIGSITGWKNYYIKPEDTGIYGLSNAWVNANPAGKVHNVIMQIKPEKSETVISLLRAKYQLITSKKDVDFKGGVSHFKSGNCIVEMIQWSSKDDSLVIYSTGEYIISHEKDRERMRKEIDHDFSMF